MKTRYEIGDKVWVHCGGEENPLNEGTVRAILKFSDYNMEQYVIEIPTHIEPILVVHDFFSMSEDAEGPIALWRKEWKFSDFIG